MTQYLEMSLNMCVYRGFCPSCNYQVVRFIIVDDAPGLHITTCNTKSWTPIAARAHTKLHIT